MNQRFDTGGRTSSSKLEGNNGGTQAREKIDMKEKDKQDVTRGIQCFKYNEIGHRSSECLRKKFTNLTQCVTKDWFKNEEVAKEGDLEVAEEDVGVAVCVVKRLFYIPTQPDDMQH